MLRIRMRVALAVVVFPSLLFDARCVAEDVEFHFDWHREVDICTAFVRQCRVARRCALQFEKRLIVHVKTQSPNGWWDYVQCSRSQSG